MARPMRKPAPDQAERDRAIAERSRNVLIDAGAGTGKTEILVDRLVELAAPRAAGRPVPIGRVAAITFTRKAAGELRLRVRRRTQTGRPGSDDQEVEGSVSLRLGHWRSSLGPPEVSRRGPESQPDGWSSESGETMRAGSRRPRRATPVASRP